MAFAVGQSTKLEIEPPSPVLFNRFCAYISSLTASAAAGIYEFILMDDIFFIDNDIPIISARLQRVTLPGGQEGLASTSASWTGDQVSISVLKVPDKADKSLGLRITSWCLSHVKYISRRRTTTIWSHTRWFIIKSWIESRLNRRWLGGTLLCSVDRILLDKQSAKHQVEPSRLNGADPSVISRY